MKINKIICLFAVLSVISAVYAQDERRQWAIDTNIGFTFFNIKQNPIDHLSSKHGKVTYLGAEYYIPDTHFSLRLGYQNEKIKIINVSSTKFMDVSPMLVLYIKLMRY